MFRSAVVAATAAARAWSADRGGSLVDHRCCALCHQRYRVVVLDGPLHDLPHAVAHEAVLAIDAVIADRLRMVEEQFDRDPWHIPLTDADRAGALATRLRSARGGLLVAALDELAEAHAELTGLRHRYTEPALADLLAGARIDGVPEGWG